MLRKLKSSFNKGSVGGYQSTYCANSNDGGLDDVVIGLQSLFQVPEAKSNVVLKSSLGARKSRPAPTIEYSCYLKSCHLCKNNLRPDEDIYMYRGYKGYCSVECREKQILLDEMKKSEEFTNQILKSTKHYKPVGRRETRLLMEDLRYRNKHPSPRVVLHRQILS